MEGQGLIGAAASPVSVVSGTAAMSKRKSESSERLHFTVNGKASQTEMVHGWTFNDIGSQIYFVYS